MQWGDDDAENERQVVHSSGHIHTTWTGAPVDSIRETVVDTMSSNKTGELRPITVLVGANGSGKTAWAWSRERWTIDFEAISARLRTGHKNLQSLLTRHEFSHPVIVIDKPENSLHPRLQATLADLFVAVAALGKKLIIETHSEPLISRLGELVFEGKLEPKHVSVVLLHRDEQGDAQVRTTEFGADGMLREWPIGFLSA